MAVTLACVASPADERYSLSALCSHTGQVKLRSLTVQREMADNVDNVAVRL